MTLAPLATVGITRYHRPPDGFTIIRDSFLRNAQTSLRAFRVGAYVLSHAAGFVQTQAQIARACGLSVTTVRAALEDLERDRYVARRRIREGGRWVGTAYAVSDRPFTQAELVQLCPPCAESECSESEDTGSAPPKKTTPVRETMKGKQINPSGGSPTGSDATKEATMSPAADLALFDVEPAEPEQQQPKAPGAQDVVAAYVDSYRTHHSAGNPSKADIGRVARDAKRMLESGQAGPVELIAAAAAMGSGPYANLGTQLNMVRERGQRGPHYGRIAPVAPREVFEAGARASHQKFLDEIRSDPEVAAWVAEDPVAMARYIAEDPSLRAVFAKVAAA